MSEQNINLSDTSSSDSNPQGLSKRRDQATVLRYQELKLLLLQRGGDQPRAVVNTQGIHNRLHVGLIIVLILVSVSSVKSSEGWQYAHMHSLSSFSNYNILGNTNNWIYDNGDNIVQSYAEYFSIKDMTGLLSRFISAPELYSTDLISDFDTQYKSIIVLNIQSYNNSLDQKSFDSVADAKQYFMDFDCSFVKQFLLRTQQFRITINMGSNKYLDDFKIVGLFQIDSKLMLSVSVQYEFQLKAQFHHQALTMRIFEQALAFVLFILYSKRLWLIFHHQSNSNRTDDLQASNLQLPIAGHQIPQYKAWYFVLVCFCITTILSSTLAPFCSFLQLLPIFEFNDQAEDERHNYMFNINKNIRFSLFLMVSISFQMYIFLNGFIFFSMLVYPGDYFDSYLKGFFSYFYQIYQTGTYEIFIEIQASGTLAYFLYMVLYFYVFLVGNTLAPALLVVYVQMKITERYVKEFVFNEIRTCVCPDCHQTNQNDRNTQIIISNPQLSPLVTRKSIRSSKQVSEVKFLSVFIDSPPASLIQNQQQKQSGKTFNISYLSFKYISKIHSLARRLRGLLQHLKDQTQIAEMMQKIQILVVRQPENSSHQLN